MKNQSSIFKKAHEALISNKIEDKIELTNELYNGYTDSLTKQSLKCDSKVIDIPVPGRPEKPELVDIKKLSRRRTGTEEGVLSLLHAIAHIEFNAINLALDAIYRFRDMPIKYYQDWLKVAKEEAYHFSLINTHLKERGKQYGDYSAHNGLWKMAVKTSYSSLVRMALVPRLLEARGLDVTPHIIEKLERSGEVRSVEILKIIVNDEVGHVLIGNYWYNYLCEREKVDPIKTFESLLLEHAPGFIRKPFSYDLRRKAGFSEEEIEALETFV